MRFTTYSPKPLLARLSYSLLFIGIVTSCSDSGSSSGCDTIANADGPAFFKVENDLDSGLSWVLGAYAFGADMKPGECTIMGVEARQFTVELQRCNIGGGACTSYYGQATSEVFSVAEGETYTMTVNSSMF